MPADTDTIRPFRTDVPEEELDNLRPRAAATWWPDRETVPINPRACSSRRSTI